MGNAKCSFLLVACFLLLFSRVVGQETGIRIGCYKIKDYNPGDLQQRAAIRRVMTYMNADILVVQGVVGTNLNDSLFYKVIDLSKYRSSVLASQEKTGIGIGLFWDTLVDIPRFGVFDDSTRTGRYFLKASFVAGDIPDTLSLFVCDFTEGSDSLSARSRRIEAEDVVQFIQSQVGPEHNEAVVVGGLNSHSSSDIEPFLTTNTAARMIDPMNAVGTWHGNPAYSGILSYPTRGVDADSGLNDRFDMILVSPTGRLYQANSYVVFGNDGMHFQDSISQQPNTSVPQFLADALQKASLHLPVYATFVFGRSSDVEEEPKTKKMWLSWLPR